MTDIILLNFIFLIVPIIMYMLYMVFDNVIKTDGANIFFSLSIITSIYLITKYSYYFNYSKDIINVLFFISILKNKKILSILIAIFLVLILGFDYKILIIFYSIYLLFLFINIKYIYKIIIFIIMQILLGLILKNSIDYVIITSIIYGMITYLFIYLTKKCETIIEVYGTVRDIECEKSLKETLFKITHEIKNPIAVIKGYLDMLDTSNSKQVNKYIPIIQEEIERSLMIMNDYNNLTKLKIDKNIMDINLLFEDLEDEINTLLMGKNIRFVMNINNEKILINGDYDRLKQVFINIIKNSIESMNEIGLIIFNVNVLKRYLLIEIIDDGIGMKEDAIKRIGEPFFTTKKNGTGLGIKLSMEIINSHNGIITYESIYKEGTKVSIKLPMYK